MNKETVFHWSDLVTIFQLLHCVFFVIHALYMYLFFRRCLDKLHDIIHGFHKLDLSVGDFDVELVLEFTDEADHVVRGEAEVVDKVAVGVEVSAGIF